MLDPGKVGRRREEHTVESDRLDRVTCKRLVRPFVLFWMGSEMSQHASIDGTLERQGFSWDALNNTGPCVANAPDLFSFPSGAEAQHPSLDGRRQRTDADRRH